VDLTRRREELKSRVAELQWDLGGLVYEMAIRNHVRVDVIVRRAATLQEVDSELAEVERLLHVEETGMAGVCPSCGAPHSSGAAYCWQCGRALLEHVPTHAIGASPTATDPNRQAHNAPTAPGPAGATDAGLPSAPSAAPPSAART
jgi:hypothetical protein